MTRRPPARDLARDALQADEAVRALQLLEPLLSESPLDSELLGWKSVALERLDRVDEAVAMMESVAERLSDAGGYIELARLAAARRDRAARDDALARALERFPERSDVRRSLADAADEDGDLAGALSQLEAALALAPDDHLARVKRVGFLIETGRVEQALGELDDVRRRNPADPYAWRAQLFPLHYVERPRREVFEAHLRWARRWATAQPRVERAALASPTGRPLRVGYVSPDFRDHAVMRFFGRVLVEHDRSRVDVHLYDVGHRPLDDVTEKIRTLRLHYHDVRRLPFRELAQRIAADRIDVLVDLAGHTDAGAVQAFVFRPAPVQLSWLGYPDTTGLDCVDGRITDEVADPPGSEQFHSERLLRLPCAAWTYANLACPIPPRPTGRPPCFGSFNGLAKLSEATLDLWSELLRRVPEATLLLSGRRLAGADADAFRARAFESRGIDPARITIRKQVPGRAAHLASHEALDVALDPFPYNGTTSTCDALWMGVPVVTLEGDRHVSRVTTSLLRELGLDDLVARDPSSYIHIASELVRDAGRLDHFRCTLRERMAATPLGDAARFARELETLYEREAQRAFARERAGQIDRPGERLVPTGFGRVATAESLDDLHTWALLERAGEDASDAALLGQLARGTVVVEATVGSGIVSAALAQTASKLHVRCPVPDLASRLQRTLSLLAAERSDVAEWTVEVRLPDTSDLRSAGLVRVEPLERATTLLPDLHRSDPFEAQRPIFAAYLAHPGLSDQLAVLLSHRGYGSYVHALGHGCLAPIGNRPTAPGAHQFFVPSEREEELVARGLLEPDLPPVGAPPAASTERWQALSFVRALDLGDLPVPTSVQLALVARSAEAPRAFRIAARRAALSVALEELAVSDTPLARLTAARLLLDEGLPDRAVDLLGPLSEGLDWSTVSLERAFLVAADIYEVPPHGVQLAAFLEGQVLSALVHAAAPYGYHQPGEMLRVLDRVEMLRMSTPRDDLRAGLCLARLGIR